MAEEANPAVTQSRIDPPTARRIALWSGAGIAALAALIGAGLSEPGQQRIHETLARALPANETVTAQIQQSVVPNQEIAELKNTIRALSADREKLNERVASLERTLDDVTGSIRRIAEKPPEPIKRNEPVKEAVAPPVIEAPATIAAVAPPQVATLAAPAEPVPLPPARVATAPAPETAEVTGSVHTDIGIDMGGSSTPEGLRTRWSTVKANFGPLLGTLKPVMAMQERAPGVMSYRLILGPLSSQTAASALCTRLIAARALCKPTTFNAQAAALL